MWTISNKGKRNGAVLFKCSDRTGLWISHMKRTSNNSTHTIDASQVPSFKLPAASVLPSDMMDALPCLPEPSLYVPFGERPSTFQEVLNRNTAGNVPACTCVCCFVHGKSATDNNINFNWTRTLCRSTRVKRHFDDL